MNAKITPADLFRYKFLHEAQLSPDGKSAVFAISYVDLETVNEYVAIWLISLETGASRQLTAGCARDTAGRWSPDGSSIAFLSTRDEKPQIYLIPVDGGEARKLTDMPQGVSGDPAWSPDGKYIAFSTVPALDAAKPDEPYRVTRHIFRFNGIGYLDTMAHDIYVVPVEGGEPRQLTNDACHSTNPVWSPDGREILFNASMFPDSFRLEPALRVVNLDGEVRDLVKGWGSGGAANWTPDGKRVVFMGNPLDRPSGAQAHLWVIDGKGGTPECRTRGLQAHVGGTLQFDMPVLPSATRGVLITKDGDAAYVRAQERGTLQTLRIALDGPESWASVTLCEKCSCVPLDIGGDRLLFAAGDLNKPFDLFVADLNGAGERQLTQLNADLLAETPAPTVEHLLFPSDGQNEIEGWFLKPASGRPPFPTVVYIHGGPHVAWGHVFSFDFQMLAGAGYAVLMINYRGSRGYGDEFSLQIDGNPGSLEYKDLMAGVDWVVEKGLADPENLGCCGGSYGGYLTCWAVTHTDRFKAAVAENPVTNWISDYGVSDCGPSWDGEKLGGQPNELPELFWRSSPIAYAHRCTTPTLLILGEADYRCLAEQAEQFYTALKVNGCTSEMLRLPNSSHAASRTGPLPVRRAQNEALLDWMNRYLGDAKSEREQR